MRVLARTAGVAIALAAAGVAAPAQAATTRVNADGNFVDRSGLRFNPANVTIRVGDVVRWRNTDPFVPHTATEGRQGTSPALWDETGTYGAAGSAGFGPGEERARVFEAGTHLYYCRVHPVEMKGTVAVPVALTDARGFINRRVRRGFRTVNGRRVPRFVVARVQVGLVAARWAPAAPPSTLAFDVEKRIGNGPWKRQVTGTRSISAFLGTSAPGTAWQVRARLRRADNASRTTDWSPVATVTA